LLMIRNSLKIDKTNAARINEFLYTKIWIYVSSHGKRISILKIEEYDCKN